MAAHDFYTAETVLKMQLLSYALILCLEIEATELIEQLRFFAKVAIIELLSLNICVAWERGYSHMPFMLLLLGIKYLKLYPKRKVSLDI